MGSLLSIGVTPSTMACSSSGGSARLVACTPSQVALCMPRSNAWQNSVDRPTLGRVGGSRRAGGSSASCCCTSCWSAVQQPDLGSCDVGCLFLPGSRSILAMNIVRQYVWPGAKMRGATVEPQQKQLSLDNDSGHSLYQPTNAMAAADMWPLKRFATSTGSCTACMCVL